MKVLDLRKELKHLYHPSAKDPALIDVPPMTFACVDGRGDPNGPDFAAATARAVRFLVHDQVPGQEGARRRLPGHGA